jgi:hypothetical protein
MCMAIDILACRPRVKRGLNKQGNQSTPPRVTTPPSATSHTAITQFHSSERRSSDHLAAVVGSPGRQIPPFRRAMEDRTDRSPPRQRSLRRSLAVGLRPSSGTSETQGNVSSLKLRPALSAVSVVCFFECDSPHSAGQPCCLPILSLIHAMSYSGDSTHDVVCHPIVPKRDSVVDPRQ